MSKLWSPVVSTLEPYVPGEQPKIANLVKLNTNESPYSPSPKVLAAVREAATQTLRLYPDPESTRLCAAVADNYGVSPDQVFVGNGSDEVLAHAFFAFFQQDRPLLFPDITYSFYPVYCQLYGIRHRTVPLTADYAINPADYLSGDAGGIVFPNPNAPTGRVLALGDIERIVAANPQCAVIIDEAYVDFGAESAVPLTARYANVLVVHTLSKSRALAGLRVGWAIGSRELIVGLNRVKNSFNSYPIDRVAEAGAVAALQDTAYFEHCRQAVMRCRAQLDADLRRLGFDVPPSVANFVFARHPNHDAARLAAGLRERGVLVRHFAKPGIEQFLRITVGDDAQCAVLIRALDELVHNAEK